MIYLVLVKFRGEWSIDLVEYSLDVTRRYVKEIKRSNQDAKWVRTDTNDPEKHNEIVAMMNRYF